MQCSDRTHNQLLLPKVKGKPQLGSVKSRVNLSNGSIKLDLSQKHLKLINNSMRDLHNSHKPRSILRQLFYEANITDRQSNQIQREADDQQIVSTNDIIQRIQSMMQSKRVKNIKRLEFVNEKKQEAERRRKITDYMTRIANLVQKEQEKQTDLLKFEEDMFRNERELDEFVASERLITKKQIGQAETIVYENIKAEQLLVQKRDLNTNKRRILQSKFQTLVKLYNYKRFIQEWVIHTRQPHDTLRNTTEKCDSKFVTLTRCPSSMKRNRFMSKLVGKSMTTLDENALLNQSKFGNNPLSNDKKSSRFDENQRKKSANSILNKTNSTKKFSNFLNANRQTNSRLTAIAREAITISEIKSYLANYKEHSQFELDSDSFVNILRCPDQVSLADLDLLGAPADFNREIQDLEEKNMQLMSDLNELNYKIIERTEYLESKKAQIEQEKAKRNTWEQKVTELTKIYDETRANLTSVHSSNCNEDLLVYEFLISEIDKIVRLLKLKKGKCPLSSMETIQTILLEGATLANSMHRRDLIDSIKEVFIERNKCVQAGVSCYYIPFNTEQPNKSKR